MPSENPIRDERGWAYGKDAVDGVPDPAAGTIRSRFARRARLEGAIAARLSALPTDLLAIGQPSGLRIGCASS
jgi:hypothetical protein